ncbi:MAG: hypothetical protein JST87_00180 [Bacteroidetes bacterium]|nr:hypothetical protein [Bacteroidota bacterium]
MNKVLFSFFWCLQNVLSQSLPTDFNGTFYSYKWIDEKVTEMTYQKANTFLNKKLIIKSNLFILFKDTLNDPVYEIQNESKQDFIEDYNINPSKFSFLKDNLKILLVKRADDYEEAKIVISNHDLILNYKGYFYFFKRSRK